MRVTGLSVDCCVPPRFIVTPVSTSVTVFELLTIGIPSKVKFASKELMELLTNPAPVEVEAVREFMTLLVHPTLCAKFPVTSDTLMEFVDPLFSPINTSLAVELVSFTTDAVTPKSALFTAAAMFAITVELVSPVLTVTSIFVVFPLIVTEKVDFPAPEDVEMFVPDWESWLETRVSYFASWVTSRL